MKSETRKLMAGLRRLREINAGKLEWHLTRIKNARKHGGDIRHFAKLFSKSRD